MEFIVIPIVLAICAAILATNKNRSALGWFFLTLLICPVILILLCLSKLDDRMGICPYCKELILPKATMCKHCGKEVIPLDKSEYVKPADVQPEPIAEQPVEPPKSTRECPYCAEDILAKAKVCKHCGRDVEPIEEKPAE